MPLTYDSDNQPHTRSLIGIGVAVGGNVLISLALNCQKLAHKRLEVEKRKLRESSITITSPAPHQTELDERHPLLEGPNHTQLYAATHSPRSRRPHVVVPEHARVSRHSVPLDHAFDENRVEEVATHNETDYLRSKLWWFGLILMNIGEFGNFLSYAYAPASVVAPLGTVALISNCFFAPIMLKEKLRKCDILGVVLAIFGAVTIIGAGKLSDVQLDPEGLIRAISRKPFVIYAIINTTLMIIFVILSASSASTEWVFIDVGLCALFGGFTVLATKALSTLLTLHWIIIFKDWITYPIVTVLIVTGVGQIKYLNRALMKFDSKVVIPTFFVLFNLSAIVGSAILYGDFQNVEVHQFTTFLYGCATTFLGVFFLTRSTAETGVALEEPVVTTDNVENGHNDQSHDAIIRSPPQQHTFPVLRGKQSSASLVLSPGQYLLLAASPPRHHTGSVERPVDSPVQNAQGSVSRRKK
ncbi:magnesium transporter NIPA-domain-containing protein [Hysterangium stoloniferum]|nr:magnesium transporter NIPA-domain-containing protein [Hysterangium stoloniferum]